jgi:hypothetical protein
MRTALRIGTITLSLWVVQFACALSLNITGTRASCPDYLDGTATANATGGTGPYTYLWNTGATTQQITDLVPGTYNCTVTDAIGTTAFDTYVLQEEDLYFNYGVLGVLPSCGGPCTGQMRFDTTQVPGGVAPFTFNPPPSYWVGDVAHFENLCAFQFEYSITDATGCTQQTGVPISLPVSMLGEVTDVEAGCNGAANGSISACTIYHRKRNGRSPSSRMMVRAIPTRPRNSRSLRTPFTARSQRSRPGPTPYTLNSTRPADFPPTPFR